MDKMDLHGCPRGEHGRFEQILNQFLLKSLHVVLDSRVPASRPSSLSTEVRKSDKWFNLALGDRPAAMESPSFWNRSLMEPMIIDVILVTETHNKLSDHESLTTLAPEMSMGTVVERWIVHYESLRSTAPQIIDASYKKTYKKSIVLLRTVYSMLRLLPAYKAFRKLCSVNRNCHFDINYKVYSFCSPFSREEEQSMKKYNFTPVDAQQGRLSVSVIYREDLSNFNLDSIVSCPPEIITDYVGSPLTPPMRAFPSASSAKSARATSFPIRVRESTSVSPFQRPHSWASGIHRDGYPQQYQALGGSPPLYRSPYEYSTSPTDILSNRTQTQRLPAYHKSTSDDLLSPPLSSSPSPSPPTYFSAGNPMHIRMRSETAPVSIPHPMMGRSPRYLSPSFSDSSKHSLPPPSPRNTKYDPSPHGSPTGIRSIKKQDSLRAGELCCVPIHLGQKISRDSKEDSGRFSSLQSSNSSPHIGFSRSSSRLSFQDDFGDCDFSCPFIVDDVDSADFQTSQNLDGATVSEVASQSSSTAKKSQDSAVGALVHMLKTAPPLRQDSSHFTSYSSEVQTRKEIGTVFDSFKPRKTSDALEELKVYREMKDVLLSRSAARIAGREKPGT